MTQSIQDIEARIKEVGLPPGTKVEVPNVDVSVTVGNGALAAKPTRPPKVVAKKPGKAVARKEEVIEPPSEDELHLAKTISARMFKAVDHQVTLCIEIAQLRELVQARGESWTKFCGEHLKNPKTGEPYAERTIRQYARIGNEGERDADKVERLFYQYKDEKAKGMKKARAKVTAPRGAGKKRGGKNPDDLQILASYFQKGRVREDADSVTVIWTASQWRDLNALLDRLTV